MKIRLFLILDDNNEFVGSIRSTCHQLKQHLEQLEKIQTQKTCTFRLCTDGRLVALRSSSLFNSIKDAEATMTAEGTSTGTFEVNKVHWAIFHPTLSKVKNDTKTGSNMDPNNTELELNWKEHGDLKPLMGFHEMSFPRWGNLRDNLTSLKMSFCKLDDPQSWRKWRISMETMGTTMIFPGLRIFEYSCDITGGHHMIRPLDLNLFYIAILRFISKHRDLAQLNLDISIAETCISNEVVDIHGNSAREKPLDFKKIATNLIEVSKIEDIHISSDCITTEEGQITVAWTLIDYLIRAQRCLKMYYWSDDLSSTIHTAAQNCSTLEELHVISDCIFNAIVLRPLGPQFRSLSLQLNYEPEDTEQGKKNKKRNKNNNTLINIQFLPLTLVDLSISIPFGGELCARDKRWIADNLTCLVTLKLDAPACHHTFEEFNMYLQMPALRFVNVVLVSDDVRVPPTPEILETLDKIRTTCRQSLDQETASWEVTDRSYCVELDHSFV